MFVGHFAVGLASKRVAPEANLAPLLAAPMLLDLLWPIAILAGVEHVRIVPGVTEVTPLDLYDYPYTHSLAMAVVWSVAFALGYVALTRDRRAALVVGVGVFSHWILDWVAHRPDLPLYPGSDTYVGLGLWRSMPATLAVEVPMFLAGVWLYVTTTRARNRVGAIAWWALVALMAVSYVGALFGPPPPDDRALAITALSAWIILPWAWWIDRNRDVTRPAAVS